MNRSWHLRLSTLLLAACAVLLHAPATSATGVRHAYRIVWDDFRHGFADSGEQARWSIPVFGPLVPTDGEVTTSRDGLRVVAKGANERTGDPAFTVTVPQDLASGGLDHVKWAAFTTHVASSGQPGFDAVSGYELSCETWMAASTYGTEEHPFGPLVQDPEDDLRLASVAMNAVDSETGLIFDFFFTNDRIYAFYERGTGSRATLGDYAAFAFAVPVADNSPGTQHHLRIGYDRAEGTVRWYVDDREVYRVDRLGHHVEREYMMLDHGGTETIAEPRQLNCGMGMFTVLDGALPGVPNSGLVRLADGDSLFDPVFGQPTPQVFHDDASLPENRLFGQGAGFAMRRYVVSNELIAQ
jgi:hypothetical protein